MGERGNLGIMRLDGGEVLVWSPVGRGLEGMPVGSLAVDASGALYAGRIDYEGAGVYALPAGGRDWAPRSGGLSPRGGFSVDLLPWPDGTLGAQEFVPPDARAVYTLDAGAGRWLEAGGERAVWRTAWAATPAGLLVAGAGGLSLVGRSRRVALPALGGLEADALSVGPTGAIFVIHGGRQALLRSTPGASSAPEAAAFTALPDPAVDRRNYLSLVEAPGGRLFLSNGVNLAEPGPVEGQVFCLQPGAGAWVDVTENLERDGADWQAQVSPDGVVYAWAYELGVWTRRPEAGRWREDNLGLDGAARTVYAILDVNGRPVLATGAGVYTRPGW